MSVDVIVESRCRACRRCYSTTTIAADAVKAAAAIRRSHARLCSKELEIMWFAKVDGEDLKKIEEHMKKHPGARYVSPRFEAPKKRPRR